MLVSCMNCFNIKTYPSLFTRDPNDTTPSIYNDMNIYSREISEGEKVWKKVLIEKLVKVNKVCRHAH